MRMRDRVDRLVTMQDLRDLSGVDEDPGRPAEQARPEDPLDGGEHERVQGEVVEHARLREQRVEPASVEPLEEVAPDRDGLQQANELLADRGGRRWVEQALDDHVPLGVECGDDLVDGRPGGQAGRAGDGLHSTHGTPHGPSTPPLLALSAPGRWATLPLVFDSLARFRRSWRFRRRAAGPRFRSSSTRSLKRRGRGPIRTP